ncbi:MAG: tetratricopeptide repeat protein [Fimbriimonas ginsengisoli]|uniref:Tetratricopeptide repeat protein n=1 Tax=Fimbriimonas ginsengisoli TaxID=1005039 RepID=A0A931PWU2_FIMGI|nr:tetratricopeptide repeat protein [Fimbriimonas ginsengisoli]
MFIATVLSAHLLVGSATALATEDKERLFSGVTAHHRKIKTASPLAQRYFDQGLNFMFGFNHNEAIRSFTQAAKIDPNCAMAWYGIALANGPHINLPIVDPAHAKAAWDAELKAKSLAPRATPVERALIEALAPRYANPQPEDRAPLDKAYANSMRKVWKAYPKDTDVGALFAEALMDLRPWDLWSLDGKPRDITPEAVQTLERVLKLDRMHPQAIHLYIHAMEASPHPEKALAPADRLRDLEPGLGHLVHMPSHIDIRVGHWKQAEVANEKAIAADAAYRKINPKQDFYRIYITHNYHMLTLAAMMRGEGARAIRTMDKGVAIIPAQWAKDNAMFVDGFLVMPLEVRKRFGKWQEILAAPEFPEWFPLARTLRHADRGVAFAALGKSELARAEQEAFEAGRKATPATATFGNNSAAKVLSVAASLLEGEILLAEHKTDGAIKALQEAVAAEDQLTYDEPPDWLQPTRHTLGAVLVDSGRYAEAIKVYKDDLKVHPNNGWAYFGLAQAYEGWRKPADAKRYRAMFKQTWRDADTKIGSSCLCLPGKG